MTSRALSKQRAWSAGGSRVGKAAARGDAPRAVGRSKSAGRAIGRPRRVGKTTFLKYDLIPELKKQGAIVIYVDLWAQPQANPADLVTAEIRKTLEGLSTAHSASLARLRALSHIEVGAGAFKFGLKLDQLGKTDGTTLAEAMTKLVDKRVPMSF